MEPLKWKQDKTRRGMKFKKRWKHETCTRDYKNCRCRQGSRRICRSIFNMFWMILSPLVTRRTTVLSAVRWVLDIKELKCYFWECYNQLFYKEPSLIQISCLAPSPLYLWRIYFIFDKKIAFDFYFIVYISHLQFVSRFLMNNFLIWGPHYDGAHYNVNLKNSKVTKYQWYGGICWLIFMYVSTTLPNTETKLLI